MSLSGIAQTSPYYFDDGTIRTVDLNWSAKQNITDNTSTISWTLKGGGNSPSWEWVIVGELRVIIDGVQVYYRDYSHHTECYNGTSLASGTITIKHNTNGSRSFNVKVEAGIYNWAINKSGSKDFTLDTIPRASVINSLSCSTSYFNGTLTYKYTPQASSFYNRCNISLNLNGNYIAIKSINLGTKPASQQAETVTLSADELDTIYSNLPKTTSGTLRFTLRTYSDSGYSNQVGDAGYKEVSLTIPASVKPKIGTITINPINITTTDGTSRNILVQNKNQVSFKVEDCSPSSGSSIKSYTFEVLSGSTVIDTKTTTNTSATFGPFSGGDITLKFRLTVTDNRGRSNSNSGSEPTVYCYKYSPPTFSSFTAYRSNSSGTATDDGTYIKYSLAVNYPSVNGTNKSTVEIYYMKNTASSWTPAANALTNTKITSAAAVIKNTSNLYYLMILYLGKAIRRCEYERKYHFKMY